MNVETEKARVIREKLLEQEKLQSEVNEDFRDRCATALTPILTDLLGDQLDNIDRVTQNGVPDGTPEERVQKVRDLLKNGEFDTVARYIVQLDAFNVEMRKTMPINEQVLYFIVLLNSYLFDDYVSSCLVFEFEEINSHKFY